MGTVRFLHTADWQLGMRRHYLAAEAEPRFRQARIDVLRTMARLAREQSCAFAVVCGDAFESNQVDRRTLGRALDALDAFPCPVYLVPGNHDPHDAGSLYRAPEVVRHSRLRVLAEGGVHEVAPGVELVAAPWLSKRPRRDLAGEAVAALAPAAPGTVRILAAHGNIDALARSEQPETIAQANLDAALADGRVHYVALGDRHSATEVAPRIWYSGAPEETDFREVESGHALVVELSPSECRVQRHATGVWRFVEQSGELRATEDLTALDRWLDDLPHKDTTVLRLTLSGGIRIAEKAALDESLDRARALFAGVQERSEELVVLADDSDVHELGLSGFARTTVGRLSTQSATSIEARDALTLLYRLARPALGDSESRV